MYVWIFNLTCHLPRVTTSYQHVHVQNLPKSNRLLGCSTAGNKSNLDEGTPFLSKQFTRSNLAAQHLRNSPQKIGKVRFAREKNLKWNMWNYLKLQVDIYDICKLPSNFTTFPGENLSQETVPSCAGKILRSLLTSQNCCRDIGIFCTSKLLVDGVFVQKILEKTIRLQQSSLSSIWHHTPSYKQNHMFEIVKQKLDWIGLMLHVNC